ncbi:TPA: hypothetical protein ACXGFD_000809 [Enterobacter cloacae]
MEIVLRNKFSSLGMLLGGIALILSIVQFSFGPFSPKPPALEVMVAEKVSAVKQGIIAGLKGERPAARTEKTTVDIDRILLNAGIILAVVALGLSFIGGMCKESRWGDLRGTSFLRANANVPCCATCIRIDRRGAVAAIYSLSGNRRGSKLTLKPGGGYALPGRQVLERRSGKAKPPPDKINGAISPPDTDG